MKTHKELLIIIPAHNEGKNIRKVSEQLHRQEIKKIADILVIDDASADDTRQTPEAEKYILIRNIRRLGYGTSLRLGYQYALRENYRYIIQMDADGQHDVCNIPVIYRRLKEKDANGYYPDIVLASRFMKGSSDFPIGILKKAAYIWFRFIIRIITGEKIADPTTGLQGLNQKAFSFYADGKNFDDKYPDANIIIQMLLLHFHIAEVPAVMHARTDGKSMHGWFSAVWYMCRMLFEIPSVIFRIKLLNKNSGGNFHDLETEQNNKQIP